MNLWQMVINTIDSIIKQLEKLKTTIAESAQAAPAVPPPVAAPPAAAQKALYYPQAKVMTPSMKTAGAYRKGYPEGAVVHFTAGSSAESSWSWGREQGYCFFVIAKDGTVMQSFPLDRWGHHAGTSSWKGLDSVSQYFVGIEIDCAGRLEFDKATNSWKSWFDRVAPAGTYRTVTAKDNVQAGTYEKYTAAQEQSLIKLLLWLKENNPDVFSFDNVVGHDSVAPSRKNDPGGALSMTIPELQQLLKDKYAETTKVVA